MLKPKSNQNSIKANLSSIKKTRPELVKHRTKVISSGIIRLHRRLQHTQVRNEPARHGQAKHLVEKQMPQSQFA